MNSVDERHGRTEATNLSRFEAGYSLPSSPVMWPRVESLTLWIIDRVENAVGLFSGKTPRNPLPDIEKILAEQPAFSSVKEFSVTDWAARKNVVLPSARELGNKPSGR